MLAAPVVYATAAAERVPGLVAALGFTGVAMLLTGAALRISPLVAVGIAFGGASYVAFVLAGDEGVDVRAPLVAGAFVLSAELAYSALAPPLAPASARVRSLRAGRAALTAAGSVAVAALVLVASVAELGSEVLLEAAGILAAVAAVGLLALLARRLT